jgi:M6 family metalloprotease-like protein
MRRHAVASTTSALLLPLFAFLAACGGGDSPSAPPTPTPAPTPTVVSVTVTAPATLTVGGTATATAAVQVTNGASTAVTWSSSNDAVATVSSAGLITALAPGAVTIRATSTATPSISGTASLTVQPRPVAAVTLAPAADTLLVGQTRTFAATLRDATGATLTDRAVTWSTSAVAVASVSTSGVVTALAPGRAIISATSEGATGSATLEVRAKPAARLTRENGDQQGGLVDRPLADSLAVRVTDADGAPVREAVVEWQATGGAVTSTRTTTDGAGVARVQGLPGLGEFTATASVQGVTPVTFRGTGRRSGTCQLAPSSQTQRFSLGPTDFTLSLRPNVPLRVAVLFVDYPNLPGTESPAALMASVVTPGLALLRASSYGRLDVTAVSVPTWFRLPKTDAEYTWSTFAGHRAFLLDVLAASDAAVDYSTFDALLVFSPNGSNKVISPTFNGGRTANVVADGRNFGNAITFGNDSRSFGPSITAHEFGHMLGLVDLYAYSPTAAPPFAGTQFQLVGAWSFMSNVFVAGELLTWEKRKLGWIDEAQVDCLESAGGVEAVLTPNHVPGGRKLVAVPLSPSRVLVAEVRSTAGGLDANLCSSGVLIYTVDAAVTTGNGPVRVAGSRISASGDPFTRCGPWADATFGFGPAPVTSYTEPGTGTRITVLGTAAQGAYRLRVTRP